MIEHLFARRRQAPATLPSTVRSASRKKKLGIGKTSSSLMYSPSGVARMPGFVRPLLPISRRNQYAWGRRMMMLAKSRETLKQRSARCLDHAHRLMELAEARVLPGDA